MDLAQPVAAGVVQRRRAHLFEQLLDHGADPHHLRRLLDQIGQRFAVGVILVHRARIAADDLDVVVVVVGCHVPLRAIRRCGPVVCCRRPFPRPGPSSDTSPSVTTNPQARPRNASNDHSAITRYESAMSTRNPKATGLVWPAQVTRTGPGWVAIVQPVIRPRSCPVVQFKDALRWAAMAYDVARVRGLHPSLGDGWVHFDAQNGMLLPDSVATGRVHRIPRFDAHHRRVRTLRQRSAAVLAAARQAVADLVGADPRGCRARRGPRGAPDRRSPMRRRRRVGLGYEVVVTRLDDEANIAPWLRAATATAPRSSGPRSTSRPASCRPGSGRAWSPGRPACRHHLGLIDVGHGHRSAGGDQAGARRRRTGGRRPFRGRAYRLIDIDEIDADVVAVNALAWGGPRSARWCFAIPRSSTPSARCR